MKTKIEKINQALDKVMNGNYTNKQQIVTLLEYKKMQLEFKSLTLS